VEHKRKGARQHALREKEAEFLIRVAGTREVFDV
jgi:hypothetical protein